MTWPRGVPALLVLLLMIWLWRLAAFFPIKTPPRETASPPVIYVLLGEGFPEPGVHQFSDGITPGIVIEMTLPGVAVIPALSSFLALPLISGEALEVLQKDSKIIEIKRYWMPSRMRMTLLVPLHPDRMEGADWEALPGIGPELARRIETNRQRFGVFGSLEGLRRVKGVGPGLVERLRPYF